MSIPRWPREMDPVSSETMTTTASAFSLMPIPARWRIPSSRERFTFLLRQHASGAKHPPVPDDDGAVMHGSLYKEDVFQQFAGDRRVQHRAAADHVVQQVFPLEHDQGAGAGLGHLGAGQHRLVDGLFHGGAGLRPGEEGDEAAAAHLLQDASGSRAGRGRSAPPRPTSPAGS